jgi:hypothetical protein
MAMLAFIGHGLPMKAHIGPILATPRSPPHCNDLQSSKWTYCIVFYWAQRRQISEGEGEQRVEDELSGGEANVAVNFELE